MFQEDALQDVPLAVLLQVRFRLIALINAQILTYC